MAPNRNVRGRIMPLVGLVAATALFLPPVGADLTVPQCVTGAPWLGLRWPGSCDPQAGDGPALGDAPAQAVGTTPIGPGWWNGQLADENDEDAFLLVAYRPSGSGGIGGGCAANPCYRILVRTHADSCFTANLWLDGALRSTGSICNGQDFRRLVIGNHRTELVLSGSAVAAGDTLTYYVVYE